VGRTLRVQLVGESPQRANDGHPGSFDRRDLEVVGDFPDAPLRFDPRDHKIAVLRTEPGQGATIPLVRFGFYGELER
jgi:hypothetical protein